MNRENLTQRQIHLEAIIMFLDECIRVNIRLKGQPENSGRVMQRWLDSRIKSDTAERDAAQAELKRLDTGE